MIFTGFRTDIPAILRALDVAVQPSLSENLGGTIEALLMQCPTVATRVGGMVDAVLDGKTGALVDPSDPDALAKGIIRLLRDTSAAHRFGIAGRKRMLRKFTLRSTVDDLAKIYNDASEKWNSGYRPWICRMRLIVGAPLCLFIVFRYSLFDAWLLRLWDDGWRPWRRNALTVLPGRFLLYRFYAFVGRHPTNFGIRKRIKRLWRPSGPR